ncbi:hypothetical protein ANCCAN_02083 [Ancylostoma caninum]|uniref:Uncharacterized protein n=1 Tax=Ancylostoma caninum TaxID=29170 RepID=A0A368H536_ANCCA|nr:hypothetical protein ANCCAN_02083 [Ancylostoma caninum]
MVGNVCERREFSFKEAPVQEPERTPSSLFECISNGVLHMDKAAKLIWDRTQEGVCQCGANRTCVVRFNGLHRVGDPHAMWHSLVAFRLQGDISKAVSTKNSRCLDSAEGSFLPSSAPQLIIENCKNIWEMDVAPPFAKVVLSNVAANWQPRKNDGKHQQITSMYRYVLLRANFGEGALGYGYDELKGRFPISKEESSFYISLGSNKHERKRNRGAMVKDRKQWRSHLHRGSQEALRDRQSKRAAPQLDENTWPGGEEDQDDYRQAFKFPRV